MWRNKKTFVFTFLILVVIYHSSAQQNHTLYFMHAIPQSNFLNPAVQNSCRIFIGLPVISGLHANLAHNGFTFNQLFNDESGGTYSIDATTIEKKIANRNYLESELYANLFVFGLRMNKTYFTFAVRERDDFALFYTRDLFSLVYKGNTQFEGEWISLKGTGINFSHFREYSIGVSVQTDPQHTYGVRAKLLFGKLNLTTTRNNIGLFTEENTFNLLVNTGLRVNASLPVALNVDANGNYRFNDNYYTSARSLVFNRKNPGFAVDAGFIYRYSEQLAISGSILDLGFIAWRSNLTKYSAEGAYLYTGPLSDSTWADSFLWDLFDGINTNTTASVAQNNYLYFLSPRIYLGATRELNDRLTVNALTAAKIYRQKILTGVSLSADYAITPQLAAALSWSWVHRSVNNVGVGLMLGHNPVQFYIVSDNLPGLIWPQSTKNLNLCFGLNLNLGCGRVTEQRGDQMSTADCGCFWIRKAEEKKKKMKKLMKK